MPSFPRMLRLCLALVVLSALPCSVLAADAAARPVTGRLAGQAAAPGTPARVAALLAVAGQRVEPGGPFAPVLAASMDRFANVTRVFGAEAGVAVAVLAVPDGSIVFAAYEDGTVRSWDARSGRMRGAGRYGASTIIRFAYDPVHRLLASGDRAGGVVAWQIGTLGEIRRPIVLDPGDLDSPGVEDNLALDFYAGGTRLVSVASGGDISIWSLTWRDTDILDTDFVVAAPDYPDMPKDKFNVLPPIRAASSVVPAGKGTTAHIFVAVEDGDVVSVGLPGQQFPNAAPRGRAVVAIPRRQLPAPVRSLDVRPGKGPAQLAAQLDDGILVWDLRAKRRVVYPVPGMPAQVGGHVAYSADGSWLMAAGGGGLAAAPTARYAPELVQRPYRGGTEFAVAGADSAVLATSDGLICLVNLTEDHLVRRFDRPSWSVAFASDGTLLSAEDDGLYEAESRRRFPFPAQVKDFVVNDVLATASFVAASGLINGEKGAIVVWTGAERTARVLEFAAVNGYEWQRAPRELLFLADRGLLAARNESGEVGAWSTSTWQQQFRAIPGYGSGLFYDRDGGRLLAPVTPGTAPAGSPLAEGRSAWVAVDVDKGVVAGQPTPVPPSYRAAQAGDGSAIALLGVDNKLIFTDVNGSPTGSPVPLPASGTALALSTDGRRAAVATDDARLTIFEVPGGRALYTVPSYRGAVGQAYIDQVRWDSTGRLIAATTGTLDQRYFVPRQATVTVADPAAWSDRLCHILEPGLTTTERERFADAASACRSGPGR